MGMQCAALVERYRSYAAKCIKISRNVSDPTGKLVLLEMAQAWLTLAEMTVAGAETRIGHETAVPAARQND
jgi:hypothetical protein